MNVYAIIPFSISILVFTIGAFVFLKDKKSLVNITFAGFCLSMFIWLFFYSLMYLSKNPDTALKMARFGFIGIIFIPVLAFHFFPLYAFYRKEGFLCLLRTGHFHVALTGSLKGQDSCQRKISWKHSINLLK